MFNYVLMSFSHDVNDMLYNGYPVARKGVTSDILVWYVWQLMKLLWAFGILYRLLPKPALRSWFMLTK